MILGLDTFRVLTHSAFVLDMQVLCVFVFCGLILPGCFAFWYSCVFIVFSRHCALTFSWFVVYVLVFWCVRILVFWCFWCFDVVMILYSCVPVFRCSRVVTFWRVGAYALQCSVASCILCSRVVELLGFDVSVFSCDCN